MSEKSSYEDKVKALLAEWDERIKELEAELRNAGPELKKAYEKEIGELIANREATRRGLFRLGPSGELCTACSEIEPS